MKKMEQIGGRFILVISYQGYYYLLSGYFNTTKSTHAIIVLIKTGKLSTSFTIRELP